MAKGFNQIFNRDYHESFAPVTTSTNFRLALAIAAAKRYQVKQVDIKSAYTNSDVNEEIFVEPPPELSELEAVPSIKEGEVLLLQKSLYGLKQAGANWHAKISNLLKKNPKIEGACPWDDWYNMYSIGPYEEHD